MRVKPLRAYEISDEPENEISSDLKRGKSETVQERGYTKEPLYKAGSYERKDRWGNRVSHQDSQSHPRYDAYCDKLDTMEGG